MAKFSRVVRINSGGFRVNHGGQMFEEEHEGTGLLEVSHQHADELIKAGMAHDYAPDMDAALEKLLGSAPATEKKDEQTAVQPNGKKKY